MKNFIATLLLVITATTANAKPECTTQDVVIGVAAGVTAAVITGVATVASMPVVGAGVAAGSTVGWVGAFSAPFLTNATASVVAATVVIGGPIYSAVGFYTTCVVRTVMNK